MNFKSRVITLSFTLLMGSQVHAQRSALVESQILNQMNEIFNTSAPPSLSADFSELIATYNDQEKELARSYITQRALTNGGDPLFALSQGKNLASYDAEHLCDPYLLAFLRLTGVDQAQGIDQAKLMELVREAKRRVLERPSSPAIVGQLSLAARCDLAQDVVKVPEINLRDGSFEDSPLGRQLWSQPSVVRVEYFKRIRIYLEQKNSDNVSPKKSSKSKALQ